MFNNDTLKTLQDTAVKANGQRILSGPCEPKHVYYILNAAGELEKKYAEPEPMRCKMFDFISLVKMAYSCFKPDNQNPQPVALWYSESGLELVIGAAARERAKIVLTPSAPFKALREWNKTGGASISHPGLYLALRTTFADCLPSHPDIRQLISKVDITTLKKMQSEQTKTKVSLDRSMLAEAAGADKLPDALTFTVPAFAEPIAPVKVNVRVAFGINALDEAFTFNVLPGEIEKAIEESEDYLFRQIGNTIYEALDTVPADAATVAAAIAKFVATCPVYRGTP